MVVQQPQSHDCANSAFENLPSNSSWIELFHSRPSWAVSQISYSKDDGSWVPFGKFQMIEASDVKPGFRVFRVRANKIELRLANEHKTVIDSNMGRNYVAEGSGRYIIESGAGCRRVADVQIADCLRPIRPSDCYVEITFESDPFWRKCIVTYVVEGDPDQTWRKVPMEACYERPGTWFQRVEAPQGINCAFSDGSGAWDNNSNVNYQIRLPGKYMAGGGFLVYRGPSDLDVHFQG